MWDTGRVSSGGGGEGGGEASPPPPPPKEKEKEREKERERIGSNIYFGTMILLYISNISLELSN